MLSYFIVGGLLPFYIGWTVWGTFLLVLINRKTALCDQNASSWSFLIFWLVLQYALVVSYCTLLVYGFNASKRAKEVRKQLLVLLRKFNNSDSSSDHEIVEHAIQNV